MTSVATEKGKTMSDEYIKKDEVIKAVAEYISCDYSTEEEAIESATILIETIPTIDIPTWIRVRSGCPKLAKM